MATANNKTTTRKTTTKAEDVEVLDADTSADKPAIVDGIYTEEVTLTNGVALKIEVIVDKDQLPASMSSLMFEGNLEGMILAQVTPLTRKLLDLTGATRKDLHEVIAPVVQRGTELAGE
ncbi:hypothetical protein [Corynebacterium sp. HMSC072A04]|uniref:hypothetical protein n=1 Tax=Corynebacterium sp. HMSC072A04 TaxID=1715045 RepID=UPI0008B6413B|nr:hypothetical protein [Corynebacterium sp. HMSC072A04]OFN33612.1 hypothetical protein HMPREF2565_11785 [Corynebacterium sp. HMSC072A04]